MSKSLLRLALLSAPLLLAACGEGYEVVRTSDYGSFDMDRTAGTGVAYVRARMLPKKEIVAEFEAEPVMEEITAEESEPVMAEAEEAKPMEEPAPALEAEEIFAEAQQKGMAPKTAENEAVEDAAQSASMEDVKKEVEAAKAGDEALTPMPEGEDNAAEPKEEDHSSLMENDDSEKMSAEDYISQEPKTMVTPKVEVIKMNSYEPASGAEVEEMKTAGIDAVEIEDDVIEVYENEVVQPQKHIIVPKKDPGAYMSVGEEELSQIYNQPF